LTEAILIGFLILALAGWSAFVVLVCRSILPMINGFKVAHEIDKRFDDRVEALLDRARANTAKKQPVIPNDKPQATQVNPLVELFGPGPLISPSMGLEEQPDSSLEIMDA
jgi:hypothetical protein